MVTKQEAKEWFFLGVKCTGEGHNGEFTSASGTHDGTAIETDFSHNFETAWKCKDE